MFPNDTHTVDQVVGEVKSASSSLKLVVDNVYGAVGKISTNVATIQNVEFLRQDTALLFTLCNQRVVNTNDAVFGTRIVVTKLTSSLIKGVA